MQSLLLGVLLLAAACGDQKQRTSSNSSKARATQQQNQTSETTSSANEATASVGNPSDKSQGTANEQTRSTTATTSTTAPQPSDNLDNALAEQKDSPNEQKDSPSKDAPFSGVVATMAPMTLQTFKLASDQTLTIPVTAGPNFSGKLKLSIEKEELDIADPAGNIAITLKANELTVQKGETQMVSVQVKVSAMTPALPGEEHFHLIVESGEADKQGLVNLEIPFRLLAEVDVLMFGGPVAGATGESWSSPMSEKLVFAQAVKVNFINMSNERHIVHGSGAIPHQNVNAQFVKDQVYSVNLAAGQRGGFYCHVHEAGRFEHSIEVLAP